MQSILKQLLTDGKVYLMVLSLVNLSMILGEKYLITYFDLLTFSKQGN